MTEDVKTPAAEPSAAETTNVQYDSWDDKGNPVVKKSEPPKQDSAPAEKKEPEPKGESAAEAGAAKESQEKHKDKGKLTADERIAQLEATIKKIKESSGKETKQAESSPAKHEASGDAKKDQPPSNYSEWKDQFDPAKWLNEYAEKHPGKSYEQGIFAMNEFVDEVRSGYRQQEQAYQSARQAFESKMDDVSKRYPEADAKATITETGKALYEVHKDSPFIVEMVNRSPVFHDLLYVLGKDLGKLAEFIQTAKSDPFRAAREVSVLEDLIMKELSGKKSDEGDKGKAEAGKETPAEPKPRAPKPPSEVGGRGAAPEDALVAAARANDFRSFDAEQTRRAVALRK